MPVTFRFIVVLLLMHLIQCKPIKTSSQTHGEYGAMGDAVPLQGKAEFLERSKEKVMLAGNCLQNLYRLQISRTSIKAYKDAFYLAYFVNDFERIVADAKEFENLDKEEEFRQSINKINIKLDVFYSTCQRTLDSIDKKKPLVSQITVDDYPEGSDFKNEVFKDYDLPRNSDVSHVTKSQDGFVSVEFPEAGRITSTGQSAVLTQANIKIEGMFVDYFTEYNEIKNLCVSPQVLNQSILKKIADKVTGNYTDYDSYYSVQAETLLSYYLTQIVQNQFMIAALQMPHASIQRLPKLPVFEVNNCAIAKHYSTHPFNDAAPPYISGVKNSFALMNAEFDEFNKALSIFPIPASYLIGNTFDQADSQVIDGEINRYRENIETMTMAIQKFCGDVNEYDSLNVQEKMDNMTYRTGQFETLSKTMAGIKSVALLTFNNTKFPIDEIVRTSIQNQQEISDSNQYLKLLRVHCIEEAKLERVEGLMGIPDSAFWRKMYPADLLSAVVGFLPGPLGLVGSMATDILAYGMRALSAKLRKDIAELNRDIIASKASLLGANEQDKRLAEKSRRDAILASSAYHYLSLEAKITVAFSVGIAILPGLAFKAAKKVTKLLQKSAKARFLENAASDASRDALRANSRTVSQFIADVEPEAKDTLITTIRQSKGNGSGSNAVLDAFLDFLEKNKNSGPISDIKSLWDEFIFSNFETPTQLPMDFLLSLKELISQGEPIMDDIPNERVLAAFIETLGSFDRRAAQGPTEGFSRFLDDFSRNLDIPPESFGAEQKSFLASGGCFICGG